MSAASSLAWKRRNRERVNQRNREWMRRTRGVQYQMNYYIVTAFAEHLGFSKKMIRRIGTLQLCLCRSDEARRILLNSARFASLSAAKANAAMNQKRKAA